ncbi:MAG: hypothetical protein HY899_14690 [Deltaproteobacteria bacterium]|nr:hypothetical protein [Deltaproteobacteria bacterium]
MLEQPRQVPSVAAILAPILARVAVADQPLLLALAERMAAARYRAWAEREGDAADRVLLLGCAEREDEVAARIESLRPDAKAVQQRLLEQNPDLVELNRELFAGRPLREQYAIQAKGERLGANTWKAVAGASKHAAVRELFLACATLEEESAMVLETLLQRNRMLD